MGLTAMRADALQGPVDQVTFVTQDDLHVAARALGRSQSTCCDQVTVGVHLRCSAEQNRIIDHCAENIPGAIVFGPTG